MYKVKELETAYVNLTDSLAVVKQNLSDFTDLLDKYSVIDDPEENNLDHDLCCDLNDHLYIVYFNLDKMQKIVHNCF